MGAVADGGIKHEGREGVFQRFLRCALRSWSRPCDLRAGALGEAVVGEGAHDGGALMSHSTGGGVGGEARCRPP